MATPSIGYIADWPARLRGYIYQQFANTDLVPIVNAIGAEVQLVENTWQALAWLYSINPVTDDATSYLYGVGRGVQLDRIGALLNQPRAGVSDAIYRLYLRAKIAALRSSGTTEDIYRVFRAMLGSGTGLDLVASPIASFTLTISYPLLSPDAAAVAAAFLFEAKAAGVRAVLEWQPAPIADLFIFDGGIGQGFDSGLLSGAVGA